MKRKALLLIFTALMAFAVPASADVFLLGFTGFDYEDPDTEPAVYLSVLDGYRSVGLVTSVGPLLDPYVDFDANEYTYYLFGLTVSSRFFGGGVLEVIFNDNARMQYWEDSTPDADYGVNPPNATAPSTFTNGILALGGDVDDFVLVYDFNENQGSFSGHMAQDEGSYLIYIPPGQRSGWTLGGLAGRPNPTPPEGYD
ncbi:MAG: hypothetical protein ACRDQ2_17815, partial [Gaiellales bacterium]